MTLVDEVLGDGLRKVDSVQIKDLHECLILYDSCLGRVQLTQEFFDSRFETVAELHEENLLLNAIL